MSKCSILLFVHKAGATFGPDGLSRRPYYAGDDEYSNPDLDEEDPGGPPTVVIHDPDEPQPLDIKDFVHEIDTRTGFMQDLAEDVIDFKREIEAARAETRRGVDRNTGISRPVWPTLCQVQFPTPCLVRAFYMCDMFIRVFTLSLPPPSMSSEIREAFALITKVKSTSPVILYDLYWHCVGLMSELVTLWLFYQFSYH